jgi:hypothetical protein
LHYETLINKIREDLKDEYIWISIDVSTDTAGRSVANVIIGKLNKNCYFKPYLFDLLLLNKTNHSTIIQSFTDTMMRL